MTRQPIASTVISGFVAGQIATVFSLVLGTLSAAFLLPYVCTPHEGAGAFGSGFGWKIVFTICLWHVNYGVNFGKMYNPLPIDDPEFASEESVS